MNAFPVRPQGAPMRSRVRFDTFHTDWTQPTRPVSPLLEPPPPLAVPPPITRTIDHSINLYATRFG